MKSTTALLAHSELIAEVRRLSYDERTGTIFITSDDNHLARIVLNKGRITYFSFDTQYHGYNAIPFIQTIKFGRLQFSDGIFEAAQEVSLPSTSEIFQKFSQGLTANVQTSSNFSGAFEHIKKALASYIGPFAIIVCENYLKKFDSLKTRAEVNAMIDIVAPEIDKEDERQKFKEELKNQILE
ncbi:MAG: hypothetical protein ABFS56_20570 [Pseudomonadota bacterium]